MLKVGLVGNWHCEERHEGKKKHHKMKILAMVVHPGLEEQGSRFSVGESDR